VIFVPRRGQWVGLVVIAIFHGNKLMQRKLNFNGFLRFEIFDAKLFFGI